MDAIKEIEALRAACEKLELSLERTERNRDMWKQQCTNQAQLLTTNSQLVAARDAEIERLKDALIDLRSVIPYFWDDDNSHISALDSACEKADEALE